MPRFPRAFLPGYPHHIVQRGHDRKAVFASANDYLAYLNNLSEQLALRDIKLYAYCLMTNHVHLLVEPTTNDDAISQLMRVVAGRQTRYVNRLEGRSGTLWEGRFKCSLVDRDAYLLACIRYIEMNPVKAQMVAHPNEYLWSSYRERMGVVESNVGLACLEEPYQNALSFSHHASLEIDVKVERLIENAVARNQLTGASDFHMEIEGKLKRRVSKLPPGRPRHRDTKK